MTAPEGGHEHEVPGRRTAIVVAHGVTAAISAVVTLAALLVTVFGEGPRGSRPLGLALMLVAGVTVAVTLASLRTFLATDRPRLLWMGAAGFAWMGIALLAPTV